MKMNKLIVAILAVVFMIGVLTPNGQITKAVITDPRWGGTLVTTTSSEPPTLNPCITTVDPTFAVAHNIFSSLIVFDMQFNPQPNLATSWNISSDGLRYTFKLVNNATFHDGKPVTSADVKFTMEEVVKKYGPWGSSIFEVVDHVETPDNYTAAFVLKFPSAIFMTAMNFNYFAILPKHLYEGTDVMKNPYNTAPVGSGPFRFVEWVRGDHVTLERYGNYFKQDKPYLDRIVYRIVATEAAADAMLTKGELDYISCKLLPQDVQGLVANPNLVVDEREYNALSVLTYLFMNCKEGHITANPEVRRAIAMAINKTMNLDLVQMMQGKVSATQFTPFLEWCYNANPTNKIIYNVTKANEILDAAGYPKGTDGIRFHLKAVGGAWYVRHYKNTELLVPQLEEIGIAVDYELQERAVYNEKVFGNFDYDLTCLAATVTPDPTIGTERFFITSKITGQPWTNLAYYSNATVDELFALAKNTTDKELRKGYFYQLQEILNVEVPMLGLYAPYYYSAWTRSLIGLPKGPWFGFEPDDSIWFEDRHRYSPRMCSEAITLAESKIAELADKGYDVSLATSKVNEAKAALSSRDYTAAKESADLAPTLSIAGGVQTSQFPDLWILAIVVVVIVVIAGALFTVYRLRRHNKKLG